jgi:hypothetical protein
VTNNTGESITVTSGHTHESYAIAPDRTKRIPHTFGDLMVSTKSGMKWTIPNVGAIGGDPKRHFIFWSKYERVITIEKPNDKGQSSPRD